VLARQMDAQLEGVEHAPNEKAEQLFSGHSLAGTAAAAPMESVMGERSV